MSMSIIQIKKPGFLQFML